MAALAVVEWADEEEHMQWTRQDTVCLVVMSFTQSGPDQQDPSLFGVGVVVKSWYNRRSALVLASPWRSGPAHPAFAPLTARQTPLHVQDPYFCSARETGTQGLSHIACISLPAPSAALPPPRDLARVPVRCRLTPAVRAMSSSYDASGHQSSVLFNTVQSKIIILSSRSDRAVIHCLCHGNMKKP